MALIDFSKHKKVQELRSHEVKALYAEHHQQLVQFIKNKGLPEKEAEDVAQEAFVKLLDLDKPEVKSYIRAYLFKIAGNLAIDKLRRQSNSPIDSAVEQTSELLDKQHWSSVTPERQQHSTQLLQKVEQCIKDLPPTCQQAFIRYKIKGDSYQSIAQSMGVSESMVRKHVLRAVRHCFSELKDLL